MQKYLFRLFSLKQWETIQFLCSSFYQHCQVRDRRNYYGIFTARNSSCGKVMFSKACVIPSVHRGSVYIPTCNGTGAVYPSMQWGRGVSQHAMGRVGLCPGGCLPGTINVLSAERSSCLNVENWGKDEVMWWRGPHINFPVQKGHLAWMCCEWDHA